MKFSNHVEKYEIAANTMGQNTPLYYSDIVMVDVVVQEL